MEDGLERGFDRLELGEPFLPKINNSANPLMERSAQIHKALCECGDHSDGDICI
jgi:hypothetical protein